MLRELQWLYPAQQWWCCSERCHWLSQCALPTHARNSAQAHPQQCPDTPAKVPIHARNSAQERLQRCPQTPATMPATPMPRIRPQQCPHNAHNSAQVARNGSPQQIEEDGGVTSDEEVLEQMLLLTRSYYLNIQAYYLWILDLHWSVSASASDWIGSGPRIHLQSNPTRSLDWWL
jgi:hypothetical protein